MHGSSNYCFKFLSNYISRESKGVFLWQTKKILCSQSQSCTWKNRDSSTHIEQLLKLESCKEISPLAPILCLQALANIGIFPGIFLGISLENGASWLERWIFLRVSSPPSPFSMDIPWDNPGNIPILARALKRALFCKALVAFFFIVAICM